ncbi:hypothetical protein M0805_006932, partial [Coniferiporia weirii]
KMSWSASRSSLPGRADLAPSSSYEPFVVPGGQPGAASLETFNNVTGTSLTWLVNQPAGTSLGLTIRDQTGTTEESASFQVQDGTTGCISSSLSFSAATTSGAATGSPASTTGTDTGSSASSTASTGSSGTSTGSSGSSAATSGSTTAAGSSTTSSSAAMKPFAQIGSAGVIGAALVAL